MPEEYYFHRYIFDIKNGSDTPSRKAGIITRFGTEGKENGLSTFTIEGGIYTSPEENRIDYLIGYNGLRSDGLIRFIVLTNGGEAVYDVALQDFSDDKCFYGTYYKVSQENDKMSSEFMGYLMMTHSHRCAKDAYINYDSAVIHFNFDNSSSYRNLFTKISTEHLHSLCEHDDIEKRIKEARVAFAGKKEDNLEKRKTPTGQ